MIGWMERLKTTLKIKRVAKIVANYGFNNTDNGNYIVGFKEAAKLTGISKDFIKCHQVRISEEINKNKHVLSETWLHNDSFDMNFKFEESYDD